MLVFEIIPNKYNNNKDILKIYELHITIYIIYIIRYNSIIYVIFFNRYLEFLSENFLKISIIIKNSHFIHICNQ